MKFISAAVGFAVWQFSVAGALHVRKQLRIDSLALIQLVVMYSSHVVAMGWLHFNQILTAPNQPKHLILRELPELVSSVMTQDDIGIGCSRLILSFSYLAATKI